MAKRSMMMSFFLSLRMVGRKKTQTKISRRISKMMMKLRNKMEKTRTKSLMWSKQNEAMHTKVRDIFFWLLLPLGFQRSHNNEDKIPYLLLSLGTKDKDNNNIKYVQANFEALKRKIVSSNNNERIAHLKNVFSKIIILTNDIMSKFIMGTISEQSKITKLKKIRAK